MNRLKYNDMRGTVIIEPTCIEEHHMNQEELVFWSKQHF